ncbi:hypothetical protein JTB14_031063 [Gonioctena quinquepunctata]|nr:hypothetical protein JTB14_031063 [Gonioctena quinquepunctata]
MKAEGGGSAEELISGDRQVIVTKRYDNKTVVMAPNFISIGKMDTCKRWDRRDRVYVEVTRPEVMEEHNKHMGGVDKLDFLLKNIELLLGPGNGP